MNKSTIDWDTITKLGNYLEKAFEIFIEKHGTLPISQSEISIAFTVAQESSFRRLAGDNPLKMVH